MTAAAQQRYSPIAMILHWSIAILVIVNWRVAETAHHVPKDDRGAIMANHFSVGMIILVLALLRLVVRATRGAPPYASHIKPWESVIAKITHTLMGLLIIVLPLLGWVAMSLYGRSIPIFGLFSVPPLPLAPNKDLAGAIFDAHGVLGSALVYLMFLHILAVIKHMVIDRDGNLFRMLPFGKVRN